MKRRRPFDTLVGAEPGRPRDPAFLRLLWSMRLPRTAALGLRLAACATETTPTAPDTAPADTAVDTAMDTGDSADSAETGDSTPPNQAPGAPLIAITPAVPAPGVAFAVSVTTPSVDPDGDPVTYRYSWTVDGADAALDTDTVPAERATLGSVWQATVTPNDGTVDGPAATATATVGNAPPTAFSIELTPTEPVEGDTLSLAITPESVDPDGDPVTTTITWEKNGAEVSWFAGLTTIEGKWVGDQDEFKVIVSVTDGLHDPEVHEASVTAHYTCASPPPEALSDTTLGDARAYHGIAFDATDGTLIGFDGSALLKSEHSGSRSVFVPGVSGVEQIDMLPDGDFVYADNTNGALVRVSPSGDTSNIATGLGYIYGVTVGPDGMVYVTYTTIRRVDPDTGEVTVLYDPGFSSSIGTAHAVNFNLDSTRMYIATIGYGTVYQMDLDANLDPTSDPYEFATGLGSWMDGVELDECGNVYIADYSDSMLWRLSPDGSTRTAMVTRSSTSYGHGVKWGNGVGDWDDKTLYQPEPYAGYLVREVEIGFASGDTVRSFNGVVTGY